MSVKRTLGSGYKHWTIFIPVWISDYIHYNVWDEITYRFLNFIEVWEWIGNFIPHFTGFVITYPYRWLKCIRLHPPPPARDAIQYAPDNSFYVSPQCLKNTSHTLSFYHFKICLYKGSTYAATMSDEITYRFLNFIEVWEWIGNFIPHFTGFVITYPYRWLKCIRLHPPPPARDAIQYAPDNSFYVSPQCLKNTSHTLSFYHFKICLYKGSTYAATMSDKILCYVSFIESLFQCQRTFVFCDLIDGGSVFDPIWLWTNPITTQP